MTGIWARLAQADSNWSKPVQIDQGWTSQDELVIAQLGSDLTGRDLTLALAVRP